MISGHVYITFSLAFLPECACQGLTAEMLSKELFSVQIQRLVRKRVHSSYRTISPVSATTQSPVLKTTEENQTADLLKVHYVLGFLGKAF